MNSCCVPVTGGSCAEIVTDGFISLSLSSETESGAEVITKKADGTLCINHKMPDAFKRFTVEMEFCGVDPDLLSFMTNMSPYTDYNGDVAGVTAYEGMVDGKFGLELWTGLAGDACPTGVQEASGYVVLGCVNAGIIGDIAITGEKEISFTMKGAYTVSGNAWGVGLHSVVLNAVGAPAKLPSALLPTEPLLIMETGVSPPPSACGCKTFAA
jgi:hypothetical protein